MICGSAVIIFSHMRKLKYLVIAFLLIAFTIGFFHQTILSAIGHLVVYERSNFEMVGVVVVPSAMTPERALGAADLMLESRAERAILFREDLPPAFDVLEKLGVDFTESHEINRAVLKRKGIDEGRVEVLPEEVDSTWEEAQAFRRYVDQHPVTSIVITTSWYHSYRTYLNFERALEGTGVEIYSVPTQYGDFDPNGWWKDRDGVKTLYVELANLAAFFFGVK